MEGIGDSWMLVQRLLVMSRILVNPKVPRLGSLLAELIQVHGVVACFCVRVYIIVYICYVYTLYIFFRTWLIKKQPCASL
jgi:hypothetical protein